MKNKQNKDKMVRNIIKAVPYVVAVVSVYLILGGVLSDTHITISLNWVMCLTGGILLILASKLYDWLFPKRTAREDKKDEK